MSTWRSVFFTVLATLLVLVFIEGTLSWGYAIKKTWERSQPRRAEIGHAEHDSDLGWVNKRSVRVANLYGEGRNFTTNTQRFRATEEYTVDVPGGRKRVIFLGDSFTMGYGVDNSETYPALVEAMDARFQSINMGMGGYGVGQSYLWYRRDGLALNADLVVFAFIAHDFERMTLEHFISPKPRLDLVNGELIARNVPVPAYSALAQLRKAAEEFTYWLDTAKFIRLAVGIFLPAKTRLEVSREAVSRRDFPFAEVAEGVFFELHKLCQQRNRRLLLVYLPTKADFGGSQSVAKWIQDVAMNYGIPFVNLTNAFERGESFEQRKLFLPDGHYSVVGNKLVATTLLPLLRELAEPSKN